MFIKSKLGGVKTSFFLLHSSVFSSRILFRLQDIFKNNSAVHYSLQNGGFYSGVKPAGQVVAIHRPLTFLHYKISTFNITFSRQYRLKKRSFFSCRK
jgi:hypothetical protein